MKTWFLGQGPDGGGRMAAAAAPRSPEQPRPLRRQRAGPRGSWTAQPSCWRAAAQQGAAPLRPSGPADTADTQLAGRLRRPCLPFRTEPSQRLATCQPLCGGCVWEPPHACCCSNSGHSQHYAVRGYSLRHAARAALRCASQWWTTCPRWAPRSLRS
jgi:hypothetical protein